MTEDTIRELVKFYTDQKIKVEQHLKYLREQCPHTDVVKYKSGLGRKIKECRSCKKEL